MPRKGQIGVYQCVWDKSDIGDKGYLSASPPAPTV